MIIKGTGQEKLDVVCLGRAGMDLYAIEEECDFTEVTRFRKSVGGSPANIAVGLARLGSKAGFIGKISRDKVGEYVRGFLGKEGVDVSGISYAGGEARTSLALTETKAEDTFVILYRNGAADLMLAPEDIPAEMIKNSRSLLVSGTAFSASPSREASFRAVEIARAAGKTVILDLDYRPYSWKSEEDAAGTYEKVTASTDILIGNKEEFALLRRTSPDEDPAVVAAAYAHCGLVIVKDGARGSRVFFNGEDHRVPAFRVKAKKPFGAGDAFAAALIHRLLISSADPDVVQAVREGSAAAALVVSRFGCAESMPDAEEIKDFIHRQTKSINAK